MRPLRLGSKHDPCTLPDPGTIPVKRCYALLCSYDGGAFSGFQRQPPLPTIQGALEDALASLGCKTRIEGAGRTDAGVHARRQVVSFRTRDELPPLPELLRLLRERLPPALQVLEAASPPHSFHARFSAVSKAYLYRVAALAAPDEAVARTAWTLPDPRGFPDLEGPITELDEDAMRTVLDRCMGAHDFSNLIHPKGEGKRRRILSRAELHATPAEGGGTLYDITLVAPGFLRHQVRNIVGVCVTAGLGRLPEGAIDQLLSGEGDRWRGPRAPGRGLTLWDVRYRHGEDPFRGTGASAAS